MLENLINKAEEKINEALQHANNVENGIKNKTTEILNAEYCMGQFMAYMDMIEGIDLDKHVEMGEKTKEIRHGFQNPGRETGKRNRRCKSCC